MKRSVLTIVGVIALAVVVALIVQRSRDVTGVAPDLTTAKQSEANALGEHIDLALPSVVEGPHERVEPEPEGPSSALNNWGLGDGGPLAKFRGRLVYKSTDQGVPWCEVGLRGVGRQVEFRTTDEEGHFESRLAFPLARTLVLVTADGTRSTDWDRAIEVHREDGEAELMLKVQLAPTLMIAGEFPSGVDPSKLTATITSLNPTSYVSLHMQAGDEHWFVREELPAPPDFERERTRIAESRAQLPFELTNIDGSKLSPAAERVFEQWRVERANYDVESVDAQARRIVDEAANVGPPWRVRFVSEHETWTGTAVLDEFDGVLEVTPQWDSLGDVALAFHGNWMKTPTWSISAELRSVPADPNPKAAYGNLDQLPDKPLHFYGLAPSRYSLAVHCDMCDDIELPVVVRGAETTNVDVQLNCVVSAGSIRGDVMTESGEVPRHFDLNLWRPGLVSFDGELNLVNHIKAKPWIGTFEIHDLPVGEFQLTCSSGEFAIAPSHTVTVRAGDFAHFRVLDRPTYIDLGFRVFDAESGAELETFNVDFNRSGEVQHPRGLRSGAIVVERLPENGRLWWSVTSPGHVCAEGDVADQISWGLSSGAKRWIDVRLQRGWRIKCAVFDSDYRTLTNATIIADGIDMGTTDADGYFTLTLPQRAKSIDARYRDWRCIERDIRGLETMESCDEVGFVFERKH